MESFFVTGPERPRISNGDKTYLRPYPEKLEQEGLWTSKRNTPLRPTPVQPATPAPLIVRSIEEDPPTGDLLKQANTHQSGFLFSPDIVAEANNAKKLRECAVSLANSLEFPSHVGYITLTAKPI